MPVPMGALHTLRPRLRGGIDVAEITPEARGVFIVSGVGVDGRRTYVEDSGFEPRTTTLRIGDFVPMPYDEEGRLHRVDMIISDTEEDARNAAVARPQLG